MKIVYIVAVNHPNQHKKKKGEKRKIKLTKDTQTVLKNRFSSQSQVGACDSIKKRNCLSRSQLFKIKRTGKRGEKRGTNRLQFLNLIKKVTQKGVGASVCLVRTLFTLAV